MCAVLSPAWLLAISCELQQNYQNYKRDTFLDLTFRYGCFRYDHFDVYDTIFIVGR